MKRLNRVLGVLLMAALVSACGTDTSSSGGSEADSDTGIEMEKGFNLRLTDAPFDAVTLVELSFVEVWLRQAGGGWVVIPKEDLTASTIEVSRLQGSRTAELAGSLELPPGDYLGLLLILDPDPNAHRIVDKSGGSHPIDFPSRAAQRLAIRGEFSISETLPTTLIVDIDLRQSIRKIAGGFQIKPVTRLVRRGNFGHARGKVPGWWLTDPRCSDADPDTFNAIYVYRGHDVVPDDIDQSTDLDLDPITTSKIVWHVPSSSYRYEAAFLPPGRYTIALTCNANLDGLDTDDDLKFFRPRNITIRVNNTVFL